LTDPAEDIDHESGDEKSEQPQDSSVKESPSELPEENKPDLAVNGTSFGMTN